MRDDFAAFILTHGRPEKIITYKTLRASGYTGKIYYLIDDEDSKQDEYKKMYGDDVIVFDKKAIGETFDPYDNFGKRNSITWARNASFKVAKELGLRFFWQLDDDYTSWQWRFNHRLESGYCGKIKSMDDVLEACISFLESIPAASIAFSQGGDHIGCKAWDHRGPFMKRKAMNSFICDTQNPFQFEGYMNEDVNTYASRRCNLFFTVMQLMLCQLATQSNTGGITEAYKSAGTYVKSFYTIMTNPAAVKISAMGSHHYRIHHNVIAENCYPKILREEHKR